MGEYSCMVSGCARVSLGAASHDDEDDIEDDILLMMCGFSFVWTIVGGFGLLGSRSVFRFSVRNETQYIWYGYGFNANPNDHLKSSIEPPMHIHEYIGRRIVPIRRLRSSLFVLCNFDA